MSSRKALGSRSSVAAHPLSASAAAARVTSRGRGFAVVGLQGGLLAEAAEHAGEVEASTGDALGGRNLLSANTSAHQVERFKASGFIYIYIYIQPRG